MARRDPVIVRRRRIAAAVALAVVVALGVGVAAAVHARQNRKYVAPPPPPPPKPFHIIFPEGFTRVEMGERVRVVATIAENKSHKRVRLRQKAYLAASERAIVPCFGRTPRTNLEGFLFPATYDFLRQTTGRQLVRAQLVAFCRNWAKVDMSYAHSKNLTDYDVLTIASMIEKEAAVASERPLMSAVIYNRLRQRIQLGIDATLRYGLQIPPTKSILESQLHDPTPYNTRDRHGLPPTPISNPGLASIRAAAHPAKVDYLFFARKQDQLHHFFTASGDEFNQFLQNGYG